MCTIFVDEMIEFSSAFHMRYSFVRQKTNHLELSHAMCDKAAGIWHIVQHELQSWTTRYATALLKNGTKPATLRLRTAGYTAAAKIAALDFLFQTRGRGFAFLRWSRWLQRGHEVLHGGYHMTRHDTSE
jgi:hypothetical protein